MMGNETDEIFEVLFESLLLRYEKGLEAKMFLFLIVLIYCIIIFINRFK